MKILHSLLAVASLISLASAGKERDVDIEEADEVEVEENDIEEAGVEEEEAPQQPRTKTFAVTVRNLSFRQPFSPFFVAVHDADADPLFEIGQPASVELATLAEDGDPLLLVELYNTTTNDNVYSATSEGDGFLYGGHDFTFTVETTRRMPLLSFASMAVNTNDGFVGVAGLALEDGIELTLPCYDAGTEQNDEKCRSIPGPACEADTGNKIVMRGEGFVHVHRGIHGVGDLHAILYDWRNPIMSVSVAEVTA